MYITKDLMSQKEISPSCKKVISRLNRHLRTMAHERTHDKEYLENIRKEGLKCSKSIYHPDETVMVSNYILGWLLLIARDRAARKKSASFLYIENTAETIFKHLGGNPDYLSSIRAVTRSRYTAQSLERLMDEEDLFSRLSEL